MEKAHVSLKDLAKELKISISSVSRALKNHPDISPELAQKVQELARQKNYKPNPYAIRLLKHESKTIGIVIPDIVTYFYALSYQRHRKLYERKRLFDCHFFIAGILSKGTKYY